MTRRLIVILSIVGIAFAGYAPAASEPISPYGADQRASIPRAISVARTTALPACTVFVDASSNSAGNGTSQQPFPTIGAAVDAAQPGAVICVAEGVYPESLTPGAKPLTLAGGFQAGSEFTVRDSARYVSTASGQGGSFIRIEDPGPSGEQLTAVDGFVITGYSQAIYRAVYYSQRFEITNNFIHDNTCSDPGLAGAGFFLDNVSGLISGNVFLRNHCDRGGAGALNDGLNENAMVIERNVVQANAGTEPESSHGGGLYLFSNRLTIRDNLFDKNTATGWGAGLYVGAYVGGGQNTTADLAWNVYRDNQASIAGGGFFCDDSATCLSEHEIYDSNCGGNIYLDSGPSTVAHFNHLTNYGALAADCREPGAGVQIDRDSTDQESYSFTNSVFWGNAPNRDFAAACASGCGAIDVTVSYSMVDTRHEGAGMTITFGPGIVPPQDPLFVSPEEGDFHLQSEFGHWTPDGYLRDAASSPVLARGDPGSPADNQPESAGVPVELGAYGNSPQASSVR